MGEPEVLLGDLLTPAQEAMGEQVMTDEFDREAYRASLAESLIAMAKAVAATAALRAAIARALAGCSFCRMGQCRADAHLWLTEALTDTQAGTSLLIRLGQFEHERDRALEQLAAAEKRAAECRAWHCSGQRRCELAGGHDGRHFTPSLGASFCEWEDSASVDVPQLLDALTEARA